MRITDGSEGKSQQRSSNQVLHRNDRQRKTGVGMIREEKLVNESREKYERCDVIIKEVVEAEIGGGRLIERRQT